MKDLSKESPFGIYSPWGEFGLDRSTFASHDEIARYITDIGARWVQELPPLLAVEVVPPDIHLYSRVGREAGMVPPLIRNPDSVWMFKQELTRTITSGMERYQYLEVDTEPDGLGGWQNDPEGYVQLLRLSHEIVKKICPGCMIMFGGLSGGQDMLDTQGTIFLEKAMAAGAGEFIDGMAFKRHHMPVRNYALMKKHYESIGEILARHGKNIHQIPVFLETCMYDGDPDEPVPHPFLRGLPVQTEAEQASGLIKSYVYAISLGVTRIFWNLLYERADFEPGHASPFPQNPFNHYGLINNPTNADGMSHKKLSYYTFKKMVEVLDGCDWGNTRVLQDSNDIFIAKFFRQDKTIFVAWWDYFKDSGYSPGATMPVVLPDVEGSSARVIEAIPHLQSGDLVSDFSTAFKEEETTIKDHLLNLKLGESPVFIEINNR